MTKYEELKLRAERLEGRLKLAINFRDNLENDCTVSSEGYFRGHAFKPYLSNRTAAPLGTIDTDEFTSEEMDMLKALVSSHVENLRQRYNEAAVKLQAVEELLS